MDVKELEKAIRSLVAGDNQHLMQSLAGDGQLPAEFRIAAQSLIEKKLPDASEGAEAEHQAWL